MTTQKPRHAAMGVWPLALAVALFYACGSAPAPQTPEGVFLDQAIGEAVANAKCQSPFWTGLKTALGNWERKGVSHLFGDRA